LELDRPKVVSWFELVDLLNLLFESPGKMSFGTAQSEMTKKIQVPARAVHFDVDRRSRPAADNDNSLTRRRLP